MSVPFDPFLEGLVVALLALSLTIFVAHLFQGRRRASLRGDFGTGFSAFLAAWIGAELVGAFAPVAWEQVIDAFHLLVLSSFAVWMNGRWLWALRRAQEGE